MNDNFVRICWINGCSHGHGSWIAKGPQTRNLKEHVEKLEEKYGDGSHWLEYSATGDEVCTDGNCMDCANKFD